MNTEPTYRLEGVIKTKEEMGDFEGPLNLILMLLSKNKIEIRDIQISLILDQYLDYLARMEEMDLEVTSEFIQMASHLLYIKTKMLLSAEQEVSELELLMASLEQLRARDAYGSIKQIVPELARASEKGFLLFTKAQEVQRAPREYEYRHTPAELLKALSAAVTRGRTPVDEGEGGQTKKRIVPQRIAYSVHDKSMEILSIFRTRDGIPMAELYAESRSRSEVVAAFISVLELCSKGIAALELTDDVLMVRFVGASIDGSLDLMDE